ncbi:MAG: hypothetical protein EBR28_14170 [Planctomycetia bacterium]|nr:hypothetical protein [Planctomycetia bacterium]
MLPTFNNPPLSVTPPVNEFAAASETVPLVDFARPADPASDAESVPAWASNATVLFVSVPL